MSRQGRGKDEAQDVRRANGSGDEYADVGVGGKILQSKQVDDGEM